MSGFFGGEVEVSGVVGERGGLGFTEGYWIGIFKVYCVVKWEKGGSLERVGIFDENFYVKDNEGRFYELGVF